MKTTKIGFLVSKGCELPVKSHQNDMGYDIKSAEDITIPPNTSHPIKVKTGLRVDLPSGFGMQIQSRSGLGLNKGIEPFHGIIDSGYTGEIIIGLKNYTDIPYKVSKGDKIAQLCFYRLPDIEVIEISKEEYDKIDSERGEDGFGSTERREDSVAKKIKKLF